MKKALISVVLLFCGFNPPWSVASASLSGASLQPGDAKVIQQFISTVARKLGGDSPEEDPRTVRTGDLNGDRIPEVAVLFTIEGPGNNYRQYLAVFVRTNGQLAPLDQAAVGGKLYRAVKLTSIQDGAIHLSTNAYADDDPACCPTIHGTTQYTLVENKLKELHR